jgi:hypothetical protein
MTSHWILALFILVVLAFALGAGELHRAEASCQERRGDFETWDLWIEDFEGELGAWQVELRDLGSATELIGIEGGEHAAYREPARYDPAALQGGHIVLAAFSTADDLPRGSTRVATLHLMTKTIPDWATTLEVAVNGAGEDMPAAIRLVRRP